MVNADASLIQYDRQPFTTHSFMHIRKKPMFHNGVIKMRVFSLVGKACASVAFALLFGLLAGVAHAAEVRSASTTNLAPLLTYSIKRPHAGDTDITYYLSRPKEKIDFPIVVLIGGSSDQNNAASITQFHRYFLRNFDAEPPREPWRLFGLS
ncbi:hypothetical protein [Caballeronia sordidicola]|uniref:hypothetical protein n=1 Tax=Caballeronia sordidicola TaxID=196367 RepID=UPI000A387F14|nr:hypothetical protein [Caballeronia sordidicola]